MNERVYEEIKTEKTVYVLSLCAWQIHDEICIDYYRSILLKGWLKVTTHRYER